MNSTYASAQEHEHEPVPGLPAELPRGERLLWQGAPRFGALALRAFHARKVAAYFALLMAWRGASALADGDSAAAALSHALWIAPLALCGVGLLLLLAWLSARSTLYTLTTKRIVLRFGVALPMTVNVPFAIIESAGLRRWRDGTGDLPLKLGGTDRIAWLHLWPHARPWSLARPEPMLRGIAQPEAVVRLLAGALAGEVDAALVDAAQPVPPSGATPGLVHAGS